MAEARHSSANPQRAAVSGGLVLQHILAVSGDAPTYMRIWDLLD